MANTGLVRQQNPGQQWGSRTDEALPNSQWVNNQYFRLWEKSRKMESGGEGSRSKLIYTYNLLFCMMQLTKLVNGFSPFFKSMLLSRKLPAWVQNTAAFQLIWKRTRCIVNKLQRRRRRVFINFNFKLVLSVYLQDSSRLNWQRAKFVPRI